jgi:hypothetical protein
VRLIRLDEGDKVVAAAKIAPEDDEEEAEVGPTGASGDGKVQGAATGEQASEDAAGPD